MPHIKQNSCKMQAKSTSKMLVKLETQIFEVSRFIIELIKWKLCLLLVSYQKHFIHFNVPAAILFVIN